MPTEQHLFSTGTLAALAQLPSSSLVITRGNIVSGGPTVPSSTSLSNLMDGNPATTATCNADSGGSEYFIIDLGSELDISIVNLYNVTVAPGSDCGIDISNNYSIVGIPGQASVPGSYVGLAVSSGDVSPVTGQNLSFLPPSGQTVTGRYLYISFTNHVSGFPFVTIGDITVSTSIAFAVLQEAQIELKWDCKELFTSASLSEFPVDIGTGNASWKITAKNVGVRADSLQKLVAAQLSIAGSEANLTLPKTISMPKLQAVLQAQDTTGRIVTFTLNNAEASGAELPFKLNDFVVQGFSLNAFPDVNGIMGTIAFA